MNARVKRADLLQALNWVEPGLSPRDFIAQGTSYAFNNGWVATYNDEICCRAKSELPADFMAAIRAKPLKAMLESMSDEEIELKSDGKVLKVSGNRKWGKVRMEKDIILPLDQVAPPAPSSWRPLPEGFNDAVEMTAETAGSNAAEFLSVVVHMQPDFMESCDRRQASRYYLELPLEMPILVRAASLAKVRPMGADRVAETDNWIHFRNNKAILSCRRHIDKYPEIGHMIEFQGTPAVLPKGAIEASKLGAVFTIDGEQDKVLVMLSDGKMVVQGEGAYGECEAELETSYRGADVKFHVAPQLLASMITKHNECVVGDGKIGVFGENWAYTILLPDPNSGPQGVLPTPEPVAVGGDEYGSGDDEENGYGGYED